jgi:hypothetical protein
LEDLSNEPAGNRWQQNSTPGSGGTLVLTFAASTAASTRVAIATMLRGDKSNLMNSAFDAAGDLLSDGNHNYTYDSKNLPI